MKRVSKRPVDHFEGKWEKGKKYTLYALVKNNGTLFRSLTPKDKDEPYVIYDSTNETFSANAGWEIVELSEDSRMSAGGNISKQDVETALEPYAKSAELSTVATSGSYSDLSNIPTDLVKTSAQTFTEAQKSQARTNLGAASAEEVEALADQKYEGPYDDGELPSASADTMGAIYLVGPDNNDEYERFVTRLSGSTYSWVSLGMTSVNLANYTTKAEVSQLEAKVDGLVNLGSWEVGSIDAPSNGHIPNYSSTTRVRISEKVCQDTGDYTISCNNGYLFLIYVVGKITTVTWTNSRVVSLVAGDIFRIAMKTDPETNFSGYTQEQIDSVVSASGITMKAPGISDRLDNLEDLTSDLEAKVDTLDRQVNDVEGPVNYIAGKVLRQGGQIVDSAEWGVSDYIPYEQGNDIEWNYGTPFNSLNVIQFYDSDKNVIQSGFWGAGESDGIVNIPSSSILTYAPSGAYVRASFRLANNGASVKIGGTTAWTPIYAEDGINRKLQKLDSDIDAVDRKADSINDKIPFSEIGNISIGTDNSYIDASGNVISYNGYAISSPFSLHAGDKLAFTIYAGSVAYLCSVNGGEYTPIIFGSINGKGNYEAQDDINVVICYDKLSAYHTYSIKRADDMLVNDTALERALERALAENDKTSYDEHGGVEIVNGAAYVEYPSGSVVEYAGYCISAPVHLLQGETVKISLAGSNVSAISKVANGIYSPQVVTDAGASVVKEYTYTANEDCDVAFCGTFLTLDIFSIYTIVKIVSVKESVSELLEENAADSFVLLNPYAGANFDNRVCAQSHEHCYSKALLESSYNRGIRVIACSHYFPSTPRYPLSNFNSPYQDYKSKQAILDDDLEMVTRYTTGEIPVLNTESGDINTDTIPQIANAERTFVKGSNGQHLNILGLLWGSAGNSLGNGELGNSAEDYALKLEYSLESYEKFNELLEDETMWQFGSRYAFGTINHLTEYGLALDTINACPRIFKAMELFNQGYSEGWNRNFRNAYDKVLKSGKRIWGSAVVDWQDDWATWRFTTQQEKNDWQTRFEALTQEEQAEYGDAEHYYMETGRIKHDRGTNVLLMDGSYNGLSASEKAKEAIKAYIAGRYYMSGLNTKSMKLITDNHLVTFKLSDFADKAYVITANGRTEYTDVDTINYVARSNDKFVRFEAFWNDGEFVMTNPVWVEPIS